jgi:hypothetical protein
MQQCIPQASKVQSQAEEQLGNSLNKYKKQEKKDFLDFFGNPRGGPKKISFIADPLYR